MKKTRTRKLSEEERLTRGEFLHFKRLITEVHPDGIVSIVSDTWDFWKVVTEYLPALKETIMARDGKVVIRPDSGDPVDILCGTGMDPAAKYVVGSPWIGKGLIECLWDIFGGTVNEKGFNVLDPHIGALYGDSITPERAQAIVDRLAAKGFASTNVVFGIGSYTYQYVTRDTYGMAIKATYGVVNSKGREIFKKPKTDNGGKNSAKGLLSVYESKEHGFTLSEQETWDAVNNCAFETFFLDGVCAYGNTMAEIRSRIDSHFQ